MKKVFTSTEELVGYMIDNNIPVPKQDATVVRVIGIPDPDNSEMCSPQDFQFTIDNADECSIFQHMIDIMIDAGYIVTMYII